MLGTDRKQRLYVTTRRVLQRLAESPATVAKLSEDLHMTKPAIQSAVNWWVEQDCVYIHSWYRRSNKQWTRVWAVGNKPNAEKPQAKSRAQIVADWKANGGDPKRAVKIRRELQRNGDKIAKAMTLAGLASG